MLAALDMGTMLFVAALTCLPLAGMMIYYSFARKTYPGFHLWTIGVICISIGAILVSLRSVLPAFVSIVLANLIITAMPFFLARGMAIFLGVEWKHAVPEALVFMALAAALSWGTYVHPSINLRISALSLAQAFFFGETLYLVSRHFIDTMGKSNAFLTMALWATIVTPILRTIITLHNTDRMRFLGHGDIWQNVTVLMTILGIIAIITALLTVNSHRMENDLKKAMDKIGNLANLDGLTNIFNRGYFDRKLQQEFHRLQRNGQPLSLVMGDIDFFKNFNDAYGHQAGDDCIRAVADAFRNSGKRVSDIAARYGGEEFVMLLPDTDMDGANKIARDITEAIKDRAIHHAMSAAASIVTLSIGVATISPGPSVSPDLLVSRADQALYKSKANGRNQIRCAIQGLAEKD